MPGKGAQALFIRYSSKLLIPTSALQSGKAFTAKGMQVLERVGKETMELLINETGIKVDKDFKDGEQQGEEEQLFEEVTFDRCFYIYGGPGQLDGEQKSFYDAKLKQIQQIFSLDSEIDGSDSDKGKKVETSEEGTGDEMKILRDYLSARLLDLDGHVLVFVMGFGLSAALLGVMGSRFKKSGKIFPADCPSLRTSRGSSNIEWALCKSVRRFQQNMATYQNLITQSMCDKQLDSGRGTLLHLCDDVIQQEDLDQHCEDLIMDEFGEKCDFDVDDAVQKLEKLGIVARKYGLGSLERFRKRIELAEAEAASGKKPQTEKQQIKEVSLDIVLRSCEDEWKGKEPKDLEVGSNTQSSQETVKKLKQDGEYYGKESRKQGVEVTQATAEVQEVHTVSEDKEWQSPRRKQRNKGRSSSDGNEVGAPSVIGQKSNGDNEGATTSAERNTENIESDNSGMLLLQGDNRFKQLSLISNEEEGMHEGIYKLSYWLFYRNVAGVCDEHEDISSLILGSLEDIGPSNKEINIEGNLDIATTMHGFISKAGIKVDDFVFSALLGMYGDSSSLDCARRLFYEVSPKNAIVWNTMIHQCVKHENLGEAQNLFKTMPDKDVVSWNTMIGGLSQMGQSKEAIVFLLRFTNDSTFRFYRKMWYHGIR
ncbi:hypothetical protein IFM89_004417 [Coptis chinensis]|uniref:DUF7798 domain-containing protein n=1 Tax=Coptis chinensis TaxID=261450 RepID=A0A835M9S9_9MAGN|nr:hypothetical protein IFM89_004417 [Coptis chinensis]